MTLTFVYDPENPRRESVLVYACDKIRGLGQKVAITVKEPTRNLEINAAMWCLLADIARQVEWPVDGRMQLLAPEEWKIILSAGLVSENRIAQGIAGGFVMLGSRTSKMTQREMRELLALIESFGSDKGVVWTEQNVKE